MVALGFGAWPPPGPPFSLNPLVMVFFAFIYVIPLLCLLVPPAAVVRPSDAYLFGELTFCFY